MFFFFQAEDGIRDLVRSRGLGDVYKRQNPESMKVRFDTFKVEALPIVEFFKSQGKCVDVDTCLLYTSDAADERSSVDLGGRRIIKKKHKEGCGAGHAMNIKPELTMT